MTITLAPTNINVSTIIKRIELAHKMLELLDNSIERWTHQLMKINELELDFWFLTGIPYREYLEGGGYDI